MQQDHEVTNIQLLPRPLPVNLRRERIYLIMIDNLPIKICTMYDVGLSVTVSHCQSLLIIVRKYDDIFQKHCKQIMFVPNYQNDLTDDSIQNS